MSPCLFVIANSYLRQMTHKKTKEKKQGWKNTSYSVITRNTSAGLSTNFKKIIANERLGVRKQGLSDRGRASAAETKYLSLQFRVSGGQKGNDHLLSCKIMSTTDSIGGGTQMNASFEQFTLSPLWQMSCIIGPFLPQWCTFSSPSLHWAIL